MRRVAIIGAGISGLSLAWFLKQRFKDQLSITVYEGSNRVGGLIRTLHHEGFLFECGPHSLRSKGSGIAALKLIKELGLESQMVRSGFLDRYLQIQGRLEKMPNGILSFLTSKLTRPHLCTFLGEWKKAKGVESDETVYDFVSRRLSPEVAEQFFDPLITGIFAGDIRKLSIRSCLPSLFEFERTHGSLTKGMFFKKREGQSFLFSFKEGLETLTKTLGKRLEEIIHKEKKAEAIVFESKQALIRFSDGATAEADHVFCATSAHHLKEMTSLPLPEIPAVGIACVHLGFHREALSQKGFGYLIPRSEKKRILGVIWDSCVFPEQQPGKTCMTVMMPDEKKSDDVFIQRAIDEVQLNPDSAVCTRAIHAIPQYLLGHQEQIAACEKIEPKLTFLGCAYYGVSVNDCIAKAIQIVKSI